MSPAGLLGPLFLHLGPSSSRCIPHICHQHQHEKFPLVEKNSHWRQKWLILVENWYIGENCTFELTICAFLWKVCKFRCNICIFCLEKNFSQKYGLWGEKITNMRCASQVTPPILNRFPSVTPFWVYNRWTQKAKYVKDNILNRKVTSPRNVHSTDKVNSHLYLNSSCAELLFGFSLVSGGGKLT